MAPAVQLPALSGHLLLSVNEIGDREAYPEYGKHQSPEEDLKDQDDRSNDNGDDESVKEEECVRIIFEIRKFFCDYFR